MDLYACYCGKIYKPTPYLDVCDARNPHPVSASSLDISHQIWIKRIRVCRVCGCGNSFLYPAKQVFLPHYAQTLLVVDNQITPMQFGSDPSIAISGEISSYLMDHPCRFKVMWFLVWILQPAVES